MAQMAEILPGRRSIAGPQRDGEGHRTYRVKHLVKVDPDTEGGYAALQVDGLPQPGDEFDFGGDHDPWAYCVSDADVSPLEEKEGERPEFYVIEQIFTTKPKKKCSEDQVEDPLLEPQRVSGDFKNTKEESSRDRFGRPITTSSWELIRGKDNEWDVARASVEVEQNVALLELDLCSAMMNRVNMFPLWGLPERCIRLSSFSWEQKFHGQCYVYYTRKFGFDIDFNTHDRDVLDEGTKVLRGKWLRAGSATESPIYQLINNPNRWKPSDFIRFIDVNGNPGKVILNGYGLPAGACIDLGEGAAEAGITDVDDEGPKPYLRIASGVDTRPSLNDSTKWARLSQGITPVPWVSGQSYPRRVLVTYDGIVYMSRANGSLDNPDGSNNWLPILNGLTNQGIFDPTRSYTTGDYVSEPTDLDTNTGTGTGNNTWCREMDVGYVHVEKYEEGNLLLLGIPLFL